MNAAAGVVVELAREVVDEMQCWCYHADYMEFTDSHPCLRCRLRAALADVDQTGGRHE